MIDIEQLMEIEICSSCNCLFLPENLDDWCRQLRCNKCKGDNNG